MPEEKWTRTVLKEGDKQNFPKKGDVVEINYTGCLYDPSQKDKHNMGKQFDSSEGRAPLKTEIGMGRVITGWDEGVLEMSLGEESILTIPGPYAYRERGFPGLIPPNATLVL
ncbi:hypothetical protein DTO027B5_8527 [Paecilomyces variotii]|nr:hypothetical protein DTO169C6_3936 [Paecilomyces variotii]KAJ9244776.1 hypothetical protein DTO169E5_1597 [Paecilomyces variotii]KAJ9254463.1 hypothetical protein DTO207G8_3654 [Paecilomyces variotii]KAJ9288639.1 hypothetical protein DTO021C3_3891 [Paecilomyces variotii]KAJ9320241.1 hypothetical protein DTO027B3_8753 [Paecilomyces variotii]